MNLNKIFIYIALLLISIVSSQDIAGNYRLSGLSVVYYDFIRQQSSLYISNNNGECSGSMGCEDHNMQDCLNDNTCLWSPIGTDVSIISAIGD